MHKNLKVFIKNTGKISFDSAQQQGFVDQIELFWDRLGWGISFTCLQVGSLQQPETQWNIYK